MENKIKDKWYLGTKWIFSLGLIILILSIVFSWRFTGWVLEPHTTSKFGIELGKSPSQIGDAIGGVTAPIIGFLGAFLMFLSFLVQYQANKIQKEKLEEEILNNSKYTNFQTTKELIQDLKNELENIKYNNRVSQQAINDSTLSLFNPAYFTELNKKGIDKLAEFLEKLEEFLDDFQIVAVRILEVELRDGDRTVLYRRFKRQYEQIFEKALEYIDSDNIKPNNILLKDSIIGQKATYIERKFWKINMVLKKIDNVYKISINV